MNRALPASLKHLVSRRASPEARKLVLSLIGEKQSLTVQELYRLTSQQRAQNLQQEGSTSSTGDAERVIPSMNYLKRVVLAELHLAGEIEKVHTAEKISEEEVQRLRAQMLASRRGKKPVAVTSVQQRWSWQLKAPQPEAPPPETKVPFGAEVGVGSDWSHLNKRRQRARAEKIARDVAWMKELEGERRKAEESDSDQPQL